MEFGRLILNRRQFSSWFERLDTIDRSFTDFAGNTSQPRGLRWLGNILQTTGTVIKLFFDGAVRFGKFIIQGILSLIPVDWTTLWELILESTYELVYFDWNQSDRELQEAIIQNNLNIITQWGQLIGSGSVWLGSIAIAGAASIKFPVLGGKLALTLGQEGMESLKGTMTGAIAQSAGLSLRNTILQQYINARRAVKNVKEFKGGKPWILAEKVDEKIESIKNPQKKAFVRGAFEGALDALTDVGYVVALSLDDYYLATRLAQETPEEPVRTVQVFPDRDSNEHIVLSDTQNAVYEQTQNYLANHALVQNRDMGTIVGQPYDDWYTLRPQTRKLVLEFDSNEKPPWRDTNGNRTKRVQVAIPNAKPGINWTDLKTIVKKFTWGNYLARGVFEDRRQMTVWGSSENEAKSTLLELAKLSSKTLIQVTVSHPEIQNAKRKKKPTVVHPIYATMLVRKNTVDTNDYTLIDGQNREMAKTRVQLWHTNKPDDFNGFL